MFWNTAGIYNSETLIIQSNIIKKKKQNTLIIAYKRSIRATCKNKKTKPSNKKKGFLFIYVYNL